MLLKGKYGTAFLTVDDFETECINQIQACIDHPAFETNMVIQPDGHAGNGSIVGSTFPMTDKIVPNTIGVDIGCGVLSVELDDTDLNFKEVDENIRSSVPLGFNNHINNKYNIKDHFPFQTATHTLKQFASAYKKKFDSDSINITDYTYEQFLTQCELFWNVDEKQVNSSIGTLGGGNHYIEIGKDSHDKYWLTIHTGSRNFGLKVAEFYQNLAINMNLNNDKNKDLAYLTGFNAWDYLRAMIFVQQFAELNRLAIARIILNTTELHPSKNSNYIESIHNYIDFKDLIVRKGAIRSYKNEKMIIPMNMQYGSLICEGKSNPLWNYSAPHGAGRIMSRGKAKKNINLDVYKSQMKHIYSTSVNESTLDEAPDAYKPPQKIIDAIEPTAKIIDRIQTVYNLKSDDTKKRR